MLSHGCDEVVEGVGRAGLEQSVFGVVHAAECVVVDDRTGNAAVGGEDTRLGLDLLRCEDAAHWAFAG